MIIDNPVVVYTVSLSGTIWDWYNDGSNVDGSVEFTSDYKVKWSGGQAQGSWDLEGDVVKTTFNGVNHQLKLSRDGNEAVLITPERNPQSKMVRQGW